MSIDNYTFVQSSKFKSLKFLYRNSRSINFSIFQFFNLVIFFLITSCSDQTGSFDADKTVFRYNEISKIKSLDPAFARDQACTWACNQLYNGLVQIDDQLSVRPCIAKSWDISDDHKIYTFHLRKDVFFHDSELFENGLRRKVVAKDFVYSFARILNAKIASPGSWIFSNVDITHVGSTKGFKAIDDTTFQIFLKDAFPPFLRILTMQYCSVVPCEVVEHYGEDFGSHPIGTGPFKFKMWNENEKLIFVRNENYFEVEKNFRLPFLDAVAITFIPDKQSAYMNFIQGKLDFLSGIDASYKDELLTSEGELNPKYVGRFNMTAQPYLNTEYFGFLMDENLAIVRNSPLKIKEIRQAINYGFDRVKMMSLLRNNIGIPATSGFIPAGAPGFDSTKVQGYNYNPEKAKQLLAQAGFPEGKGLPEIDLHTSASYLDLCEYIQHQLSDIGIKLNLEVDPPSSLRQYVAKASINFFRGSWIADYGDAENYLALFYSKNFCPNGPNYTHFKDQNYDQWYEKAKTEVNDSIRFMYYQQMDQIIMDNAPVSVLYYDEVLRFVQSNIEGLGSNAMNLLTLKRVKKYPQ